MPLNKITMEVLQKFYTDLKQNGRLTRRDIYGLGVSDRLVEGCHLRIRSALAEAVEERLIHRNPAEECKLPQSARREKQVLTREELQRFLTQAQEEGYYEMVLLELATGLRRGEILALKWSDLNPKTGELRVEWQVYRTGGKLIVAPPKTKTSARSLLIPKALLDILVEMRSRAASEWMFPSPVKPSEPFRPYKGLRRRAGTGCITRVSENCYEGKYTPRLPNNTRLIKSVYAPTYAECETKLAALIAQVKPEVDKLKREMREGMGTSKTVTL